MTGGNIQLVNTSRLSIGVRFAVCSQRSCGIGFGRNANAKRERKFKRQRNASLAEQLQKGGFGDLLLHLLTEWLIRLSFYGTQPSRNVENVPWHSRLCSEKGGVAMNSPQIYSLGLLHGGLLLGFVWLVWPKNKRK